jgi:predicted transposase YbfD/YdcC
LNTDSEHGRIVERELSRVNTDPQTAVFPETQAFLRSRNLTTKKKVKATAKDKSKSKADAAAAQPPTGATDDKTESDLTRVFISSHDPNRVNPQTMAEKIRSHWSCESGQWQRDALWKEDMCLMTNANAACALALIRTGLQTLLRRIGRASLPTVFEDVAHALSLGLG